MLWNKLTRKLSLLNKFKIISFSRTHALNFEKAYNNPWPGDGKLGQFFLQGQIKVGEKFLSFQHFISSLCQCELLLEKDIEYIHGFEWLKNLRCVTDNSSRKLARQLIAQWMNTYKPSKNMQTPTFSSYIIAKRLENWISFFDFYGASADNEFLNNIQSSIVSQFNILQKIYRDTSDPLHKISELKALLYVNHIFKNKSNFRESILNELYNIISKQVYPDGGHKSLDPTLHLYVLRDLIDVRSFLRQNLLSDPPYLTHYINLMIPILRLFRHGDGTLTTFKTHLSKNYEDPSTTLIDMILSLSDVKGRPALKAPDMGYERLNVKSSQLILNTKPHLQFREDFCGPGTGILNFEWSIGKNRYIERSDLLIQTKPNQWIQVPITQNSPKTLRLNRNHKDGQSFLEVDFESVIPASKFDDTSLVFNYKRQLYMGKNYDLRGQERILLSQSCIAAIRFVFQHDTEITVSKNSQTPQAIIKFKNNDSPQTTKKTVYTLWRFIADECEEISVQHNEENGQKAILLLQKLKEDNSKTVKWAFHPIS